MGPANAMSHPTPIALSSEATLARAMKSLRNTFFSFLVLSNHQV
jgi:hypothetical protein